MSVPECENSSCSARCTCNSEPSTTVNSGVIPSLTSDTSVNRGHSVSKPIRVSVVAFVTRSSDRRFLLGKRLGKHGNGQWQLPGGALDYGETFEECMVREVQEETGVDCIEPDSIRQLITTNELFEEPQGHWVAIFMAGRVTNASVTPRVMEPEKCECWVWASWEELQQGKYMPMYGALPKLAKQYKEQPF